MSEDKNTHAADETPPDDAFAGESAEPGTSPLAGEDEADTQPVEAEVLDGDPDDEEQDGGDEPESLYTRKDVAAAVAEAQDRMLRVMAEYDNFRRRTAREKEQWIADALEDFVKDLLPVFDSFDKARECETGGDAAAEAMKQGLDVTHKLLRGVLDKYRIEVIDPVGEPFDPTYHEALLRQPSPDHAPGTVVTVFERGYKLGSRLIRPARTVVAAES